MTAKIVAVRRVTEYETGLMTVGLTAMLPFRRGANPIPWVNYGVYTFRAVDAISLW